MSVVGFALPVSAHEEDANTPDRLDQPRAQQSVYERGGFRTNNGDNQVYEGRGVRADDGRRVFESRQDGLGRLQREINHLNRMMDHVRGEIRAYGGGRRIRAQYEHLRAEAYQLNNSFRRGEQYYDRRRLRAQIEHMHEELHQNEQNLHVRANDFYQWR